MSSFDMTSQRFFRTDGANQYVEWAIGASERTCLDYVIVINPTRWLWPARCHSGVRWLSVACGDLKARHAYSTHCDLVAGFEMESVSSLHSWESHRGRGDLLDRPESQITAHLDWSLL